MSLMSVSFGGRSGKFCRMSRIASWQTDKLVVSVYRGHPIRIEDLAGQNVIYFPRKMGVGIYDHFLEPCSKRGFLPNIVPEGQEGATIFGPVATGLDIAVAP
jgi:hypothetical protein